MRRPFTVLIGTVLSLVLMASVASAHECINVSRNANGTAGAAGSHGWVTLSAEDIFGFLTSDAAEIGLPSADASAIPAMVADAEAAGLPSEFVVLAHAVAAGGLEDSESSVLSNGHGIDHLFEVYFGQILGAYCGNASGDPAGTLCA